MAYISSIVYDPPAQGFPYLAVVFRPDGEVLVARAVESQAVGEALIASVMSDFEEKLKQGD